MESLESIKARIETAIPGAKLAIIKDAGPAAQHSLSVDGDHAVPVAVFLRDDPQLRLDYLSNVTGVDWLDRIEKQTTRTKQVIEGIEREIQQTTEIVHPAYLEAVYHLYSTALKHGPLILRQRTADRSARARIPSFTPIWRAAEFQEREVYDLFGIVFDGHPDLRRILMWDGFKEHPMRKDYVEPDDYEYEPTAHDEIAQKAARHQQ